jgi:Protein of unknown function (DUF3102)
MAATAILGFPARLSRLARQINAEHGHVRQAQEAMAGHARRAGELLVDAKKQVQHGEWLPWLAANCPDVSPDTAQVYMRIARRWPDLPAERARFLSIRECLTILGPKDPRPHRVALAGQLELFPDLDPARVIAAPTTEDVSVAIKLADVADYNRLMTAAGKAFGTIATGDVLVALLRERFDR